LSLGTADYKARRRAAARLSGSMVSISMSSLSTVTHYGEIDAFAAADKPCLIGKFSFPGNDAGLPTLRGAGQQVATPAERAVCFRS
jgi:hypothetical protein